MVDKLINAYNKYQNAGRYNEALMCLNEAYKLDSKLVYKYVCDLRKHLKINMTAENTKNYMEIMKKSYLLTAKDYFDDYCIYLEWNRQFDKRFYMPRRKQLLKVANELQRLSPKNDEIDLLCISLPPGVGKTTIALFFLSWLGGNYPDEFILTSSHNNSFLAEVYREIQRLIESEEYLFYDVFPESKICSTNAKDMRLDLGTPSRFQTFQFSSIGSGNAGKVRASLLLYCDDLIAGYDEAINKEQLDKKYNQYTTDLTQRKIGNCKELHIATRWSVHDVIGRLERDNENNPRAEFIVCPALNENDESNFDYPYGLGFTTAFYLHQREIMDNASWKALYMNEPIEREGLLYNKDELRRYFELPNNDPDGIIAVCDTKDKGSDDCCMPILFVYGKDCYVEKIFVSNENPNIIEPLMAHELCKYKVQQARFESNSAGGRVAENVQKMVKEKGGICKINTKYTTQNKETKIIVESSYVIENFIFKDDSVSDRDYKKAVDKLCSYTMAGKNKHDDVADAFAQASQYVQTFNQSTVLIKNRYF